VEGERSSSLLIAKEPPLTGGMILRITPPVKGGSLAVKRVELYSPSTPL